MKTRRGLPIAWFTGAALLLAAAGPQVQAATRTWNNAFTSGSWTDGAYWGGTAPGSGDTANWTSKLVNATLTIQTNNVCVDGQYAATTLQMDWTGLTYNNAGAAVFLTGAVANASLSLTNLYMAWGDGNAAGGGVSDTLVFSNMSLAVGSASVRGGIQLGQKVSSGNNYASVGTVAAAGTNATFTAYLTQLLLGFGGSGTAGRGLGTLDLSQAKSVVLDVSGNVEIGSSSSGSLNYQSGTLVLNNGMAKVGNLYVGYTTGAEVAAGPDHTGTLTLSNTIFQVVTNGTVFLGGRGQNSNPNYQVNQESINIAANGVPGGLDIQNTNSTALTLKNAALTNSDGSNHWIYNQINVSLGATTVVNGWYWGLRWAGNHVTNNTQTFRGSSQGLVALLDATNQYARLRVMTNGLSSAMRSQHLAYLQTLDPVTYGSKTPADLTPADFIICDNGYTYVGVHVIGGPPVIDNAGGASNITASSANLNGTLTVNGTTPATVSVYWGPTDGGPNAANWSNVATFAAGQWADGSLPTTNITTLNANTLYYYCYYASNTIGSTWAQSSKSFINGGVGILKTADASEIGLTPGTFMVYRASTATNVALTVNYVQSGGTAVAGTDFVSLPGSVTLPAGVTNASIVITPLMDYANTNATTLQLALTTGSVVCLFDASSNAILTISNLSARAWAGTTGDWFDKTKWSPNDNYPQAGEDVYVTAAGASIMLTNATANLSSLTLSKTITFSNWNSTLTATNVYVLTNGTMTCGAPITNGAPSNNVSISCTSLRIDLGGKINVDGMGYLGSPKTGLGSGPNPGNGYAGGGAYGSITNPIFPGSGGGGFSGYGNGGNGGGAIRVTASGAVTVNGGSITARGGDVTGDGHAGGGAGGSIWITCATFVSTSGIVQADGGTAGSSAGYGGSGGRISIQYQDAGSQTRQAFQLSANRGSKGSGAGYGDYGTFYTPGVVLIPDATTNWYAYVYGATPTWSPSSIQVVNSALMFVDPVQVYLSQDIWVTNGVLSFSNLVGTLSASNVTVNGSAFAVSSTNVIGLTVFSNLTFNSSAFTLGNAATPTQSTLQVNGSLVLTNSSTWTLYSGPTNSMPPWTNYGCLVTISNDLCLDTNCWVYLYSAARNGGAPCFQLNNLTINTNGGFNAVGKGYRHSGAAGYGPGKGGGYQGASYGGVGGYRTLGTYGDSNAPVGSGSGSDSALTTASDGGGVVRVDARGIITMNGSILTDGGGGDNWSGGSSGGSVYLRANSFGTAYGTISASGYSVGANQGGGGGGRIAMYYVSDNFAGTVTAAGGTGGKGNGATGTVVRTLFPGLLYLNVVGEVAGVPQSHGTATPYNYGQSGVLSGTPVTESVPSPADIVANTVRYDCLGWTLTGNDAISGNLTQVVFTITNSATLTWHWTNVYYLATSGGTNGSADMSGWYTNGTSVTITPTPLAGYHFSQWSGGGVPEGAFTNNPLQVSMTRPRTIVAQFAKDGGEAKTWIGSGDWFNATNWSSGGAPGALDSVTISGGAITLVDPALMGSLMMTGGTLTVQKQDEVNARLQVSGALTLGGAATVLTLSNSALQCGSVTLTNSASLYVTAGPTNWAGTNYAALVSVAGDMTLCTNCWVYPTSDPVSTNSYGVFFSVGNLIVSTNAGFNATGRGFKDITGPGHGTSEYGGGGYGGQGGTVNGDGVGGQPYGSSNAPTLCGSGGGEDWLSVGLGGRGGGLVRIAASNNLILAGGTIIADGGIAGGNGGGSGSGGGVYLMAARFIGTNGAISAQGGNAKNSTATSAGGGGRIAMISSKSDTLTGLVTVNPGGVQTLGTLPGTGTIYRLLITSDLMLNVAGNPVSHGTPAPNGYGPNAVAPGTVVTNSVASPADVNVTPGVQYVLLNWVVTNAKPETLTGATTNAIFTMDVDQWLTYNWTTMYYLATSAGTNGALAADMSGWYTNGNLVTITPSPLAGYHFSQWTGTGVPDGAFTNNPLQVSMTRPRTIVVQFAKDGAGEAKTWIGAGDWFSATNWSSVGAPGALDTVTIPSGNASLADPTMFASLTMTGGTLKVWKPDEAKVKLQVAGAVNVIGGATSLTISNSTLQGASVTLSNSASLVVVAGPTNWPGTNYAAMVDIGGDMILNTNCWVYPTSDTHNTNSYGAFFRLANLTIASNAGFNAKGLGWAGVYPGAVGYGLGAGYQYGGAGYGGAGGGSGAGGPYGSSNAPVHPGSGGGSYAYGNEWGGNGGGVIRIQAASTIALSGRLDADGTGGGWHAGSGSGGSIWLTCVRLTGPSNAVITACGGGVTSSGSGGGGRIAIYDIYHAYLGTISVTGGVSSATIGNPGTYTWHQDPHTGSVIIIR